VQIISAAFHFLQLGIPIFRRTTFHDIAYIDLLPAQPDSLNNIGQQFTCLTHKRASLHIFPIARGFTDKHQPSVDITFAEDSGFPGKVEWALLASGHLLLELREKLALLADRGYLLSPLGDIQTLYTEALEILKLAFDLLYEVG